MTDCISFKIVLALGLIFFLLIIRTFVGVVPSLMATVIRWKESLNLEASVKLSRDRNTVADCAAIFFCLIVIRYDVYDLKCLQNVGLNAHFWILIGTSCLFIAVRTFIEHTIRPRRIQAKSYVAVVRVSYSFFIVLTMLLLLTSGIATVFDISLEHTRNAILWISALTYLLHLVRKLQILSSSCSIFAGFLYICALEILPT
jgi:hypothetical protein